MTTRPVAFISVGTGRSASNCHRETEKHQKVKTYQMRNLFILITIYSCLTAYHNHLNFCLNSKWSSILTYNILMLSVKLCFYKVCKSNRWYPYTLKAQLSFSAGVALLIETSAVAHSLKSIWPLLSSSRNLTQSSRDKVNLLFVNNQSKTILVYWWLIFFVVNKNRITILSSNSSRCDLVTEIRPI